MDINCTSRCSYQKEGKCTLSSLTDENNIKVQLPNKSDPYCPYCIGID